MTPIRTPWPVEPGDFQVCFQSSPLKDRLGNRTGRNTK